MLLFNFCCCWSFCCSFMRSLCRTISAFHLNVVLYAFCNFGKTFVRISVWMWRFLLLLSVSLSLPYLFRLYTYWFHCYYMHKRTPYLRSTFVHTNDLWFDTDSFLCYFKCWIIHFFDFRWAWAYTNELVCSDICRINQCDFTFEHCMGQSNEHLPIVVH